MASLYLWDKFSELAVVVELVRDAPMSKMGGKKFVVGQSLGRPDGIGANNRDAYGKRRRQDLPR